MARIQEVLLLVGRLNYTWTNSDGLLIYLWAHLLRTNKEAAIGKVEELNDEEMERIRSTIEQVVAVNKAIWRFLHALGVPL